MVESYRKFIYVCLHITKLLTYFSKKGQTPFDHYLMTLKLSPLETCIIHKMLIEGKQHFRTTQHNPACLNYVFDFIKDVTLNLAVTCFEKRA